METPVVYVGQTITPSSNPTIVSVANPIVTINNTVTILDQFGVYHNVDLVLRASLDMHRIVEVAIISISAVPIGISAAEIIKASLGYMPKIIGHV